MSEQSVELPPKYQAKESDDAKLPVELQVARPFSQENIDRLQKDLGHIQITGARIAALHELGLSAEVLGFIRTLKGGVIVSADTALQTMTQVGKMIENPDIKPKEKLAAATVVAALVNAYGRLQSGAVRSERDVAEVVMQKDEQKRNRFKPGIRGPSTSPPITV